MKVPVSRLNDPVMQAVPAALIRAAERARRLAEQTGTRFIVRPPAIPPSDALDTSSGSEHADDGCALLPPIESA